MKNENDEERSRDQEHDREFDDDLNFNKDIDKIAKRFQNPEDERAFRNTVTILAGLEKERENNNE